LEGEQDRLHTKFLVVLRFHAESPLRCRLGLPEIQSTHLTSSFTTFDECRECGAAFSHALRGHTHSTQPGAAAQGPQASQFLDGAELRAWLGHYHAPSGSASSGRNWRGRANVLTVYLFDLARDEPLLLDGESQVVAFEDMVIAVQSNTARQPADYECDDEDDGTGRGDEGGEVIPTPLHVLGRISPIFPPFFLVFCAFSPSRRDGSNEPHAGTQGQETVARAPKHRFAGLS